MRHALASALLLAACASPEEAFVGTYIGTQTCDGRNADTGELVSTGPDPISIEIDRDASTGEAFIAGRCQIDLDVRSTSSAALVPSTCEAALPDGTPATLSYVSGSAELSGNNLRLDYSVLAMYPGSTLTIRYVFTGFTD